jgi:hypothetical protein
VARSSFRIGIAALIGGLITGATRPAVAVDDGSEPGVDLHRSFWQGPG